MTAQAYYQKRRHQQDAERKGAIDAVLEKVRMIRRRHPRLGGRKLYSRLYLELQPLHIGRDKFYTLLRTHKLLVRPRRRRVWTTDSNHRYLTYEDLIKGRRRPTRVGEIYQSDITYVRVGDGFAYAALVTDAFSRKIVGYDLSLSRSPQSALRALRRALRHRVDERLPLIHHSDRGVQYCCSDYIEALQAAHAEISMGRKGHPEDNALAERVNGILKDEYGLGERFNAVEQARKVFLEAILLYNSDRPHLSLNYQTPDEVHRKSLAMAA